MKNLRTKNSFFNIYEDLSIFRIDENFDGYFMVLHKDCVYRPKLQRKLNILKEIGISCLKNSSNNGINIETQIFS